MLDNIKAYALEKYAGDEAAADEFVNGFVNQVVLKKMEKSATDVNTLFDNIKSIGKGIYGVRASKDTFGGSLMQGVGQAVGKGLGSALMFAGAAGLGSAASIVANNNLHTKFLSSLEKAISSNRIIREANKDRVRQYAETVFKFAPNVAADANLLSAILANAIHGEGIDPMTIKTLTELESRYRDNTAVNPKTFVSV
jgi:hypothetical protein